jgi:transposase-like protein
MIDDVECPYCGEGQEINHDDGYGYEEGDRHEQSCSDCGKTFVFTTSISYYYEAEKADCLNGGAHVLEISATYPREHSRMGCRDCDFNRKPTPEEFVVAGIVVPVAGAK